MCIGIMQPYFFPYIGYFQLVKAVDTFVVFDNIQYTRVGWFRRNNILQNGQKHLFSIPLKKDSDYLSVRERVLSKDSDQQIRKIIANIENGYHKAPYYNEVFPLLKDVFGSGEKNLFDYIYHSIQQVVEYLEIDTKIILSSTLDIDHQLKSAEKIIAINKFLHSDHYINAIGGKELYDKDRFVKEGITLNFLETGDMEYKQFNNKFVPNLSIIDVMMFNSKDEIKEMLNRYRLI